MRTTRTGAIGAIVLAMMMALLLALPSSSFAGTASGPTLGQLSSRIANLSRTLGQTRGFVAKNSRARKQAAQTAEEVEELSARVTTTINVATTALGQLREGLTTAGAGLQTLRGVVQDQIVPGLTALRGSLENTIGPGLTRLSQAYSATEYGAIGGFFTDDGSSAFPQIVSSDIPDSGNPATVSGSIPVLAFAGDPASDIKIVAAIRSAEIDGAATGDPAGQVGITAYLTDAQGNLLDSVITGPSQFAFPGAAQPVNLRLRNIQEKAGLTALLTTPNKDSINAAGNDNQGNEQFLTLPANNGQQPVPYLVYVTAQFFDIPTSASPGPQD